MLNKFHARGSKMVLHVKARFLDLSRVSLNQIQRYNFVQSQQRETMQLPNHNSKQIQVTGHVKCRKTPVTIGFAFL